MRYAQDVSRAPLLLCLAWADSNTDTATAMTASVFKDENFKSRLQQMHPFRGLGEPEDLAMAAVTLASADARWITGVSLPVDGGYTAI